MPFLDNVTYFAQIEVKETHPEEQKHAFFSPLLFFPAVRIKEVIKSVAVVSQERGDQLYRTQERKSLPRINLYINLYTCRDYVQMMYTVMIQTNTSHKQS